MTKWKVQTSEEVLQALPYLSVEKQKVLLPSGKIVDDYYQVKLSSFTSVLATLQNNKLLVFKGYRHGVKDISYSFPGGSVEKEESIMGCAQRELLEETGYFSKTWEHKGSFVGDASKGCGKYHIFLASNLEKKNDPISNDLEEEELIEMLPSELLEIVKNKEIVVSQGFIATLFFALN